MFQFKTVKIIAVSYLMTENYRKVRMKEQNRLENLFCYLVSGSIGVCVYCVMIKDIIQSVPRAPVIFIDFTELRMV